MRVYAVSQYWPGNGESYPAISLFTDFSASKAAARQMILDNYEDEEYAEESLEELDCAVADMDCHIEMGDCGVWLFGLNVLTHPFPAVV